MKKIRLSKYLSVEELSEELNTTPNNIYMIERGERQGSIEFWSNFQRYFKISDEDMWGIIKGGE